MPAEPEDHLKRPAYIRDNDAGVAVCDNRWVICYSAESGMGLTLPPVKVTISSGGKWTILFHVVISQVTESLPLVLEGCHIKKGVRTTCARSLSCGLMTEP